MSDFAKSGSKIDEIVYSLSWAHKLAGFNDPCKSDIVNFARDSAHRKIGYLTNKKEPVTPAILNSIVNAYGNENSNLKDVRIATLCLLCYSGFLRFSEFANLRRSDIIFPHSYQIIFV